MKRTYKNENCLWNLPGIDDFILPSADIPLSIQGSWSEDFRLQLLVFVTRRHVQRIIANVNMVDKMAITTYNTVSSEDAACADVTVVEM